MSYLIGKPRPMKRLIALMICAVSLDAAAQSAITYPYNPDGNADSLIGVSDIQDLLSNYGLAFTPNEVLIDGGNLTEILAGLYSMIDSMQEASNAGQLSFPFLNEIEIVDCGHILDCAVDCPVVYDWNPPAYDWIIEDCDRPTWVRYKVVADWFDQVDSCRFMYSYKAPSSQYGTPGSFGAQGISASGIGTDTLRFTFYSRSSNAAQGWSELADIPIDLIPEAIWVVLPNIYDSPGNRYHIELSVLIDGVWYNTNLLPFR